MKRPICPQHHVAAYRSTIRVKIDGKPPVREPTGWWCREGKHEVKA